MAHNLAVEHSRSHPETASSEELETPPGRGGALGGLIAGERSTRVQRALGRLSDDHRQVLILRFVLEQSTRELGQVMGRSEVSVRGLQLRALESLRAELETEGVPR